MRTLGAAFNWKTALLSAFWRSVLFFSLTANHGWRAASTAFALESVFRIVASGLFGAAAQSLTRLRPVWLSALLTILLIPAAIQAAEFLLHWLAGTPNLAVATIASAAFSALSAIFHWFVMRRGALTSGPGQATLGQDLRRMPSLIAEFLLAGPRALWRIFSLT